MTFGDLTDAATAINFVQSTQNKTLSGAQQQSIANLVTPASEFLRTYCDRWIGPPQDWQELRDGQGPRGTTFPFFQWPVQAVALVVINGVTIPPVPPFTPAAPGQIAQVALSYPYGAGYNFTATELTVFGYRVPRRKMCVQLTYTAGYPVIPPDITQACLELIAFKYRELGRLGISSEAVSGVGSQTYLTGYAMMKDTKAVLLRYMRVAPISAWCNVVAGDQTNAGTIAAVA